MTDKNHDDGYLIQPQYASRLEWEKIAGQEGLGYEILELSMGRALAAPLMPDERRGWYLRSGRVRSVHGAFIDVSPASGDEGIRVLSRKRCADSCALAKSLGAVYVVFHSSCCTFLRGGYLDAWAGSCASFYEMLADKYDIQIMIENSQDTDSDPLKELMKRISDQRVGVCLDLGHVNYSRMPMEEWFDNLGEWIRYLHLSDNNGLYDDHLPLGQGSVDWKKADALWKSLGRQTPMTLETGGLDGVRQSLQYLRLHGLFESGGSHPDSSEKNDEPCTAACSKDHREQVQHPPRRRFF